MPRVLLVCGSLQRASANRAALDVARAALSALGVEATLFDELASIPPLNPDHTDQPGEAVQRFRARFGAADGVLIAAPEYAGGLAGVVKNALDWIVGSGELYRKPIGLVSAGTSGGVLARKDLVRTLSWQGAHVVASLGIVAANTKSVTEADGARRITDAATVEDIHALAASLVAAIAQPTATRADAITRLALEAGIDPAPLLDQLAALEDGDHGQG